MVKNPPANAGALRDAGSVPGLRRSPGGHSNPLQYSRLENPMDRGAWRTTVHKVAQSQTQLKGLAPTRITPRAQCPWSCEEKVPKCGSSTLENYCTSSCTSFQISWENQCHYFSLNLQIHIETKIGATPSDLFSN